jgi:acylphosphatase
MKATRVFYEGKVQGVGFRWTTRKIAQGYDVTGLVKNLPDGRVELQVSGDADEVKSFLQDIRDSGIAGHIAAERVDEIAVPTPFKGFQIVA